MKSKKCLGLIMLVMLMGTFTFGTGNGWASGILKLGDDRRSVELYGQINRALTYGSDGNDSTTYNVDNSNSSTRFGLKGKFRPHSKLTVGANFEAEYQINPSNKVNQLAKTMDGDFKKRAIEAYLKGDFGTLFLGHGKTASDGTSEVDLSGTSVVGYSGMEAMAGGLLFFDRTAGALSAAKVGDTINNYDGYSRKDRVRYDTPLFKGFNLGVSLTSEDGDSTVDGALWYKGTLGDTKLEGAIAYVDHNDTKASKNQVNGSISMLLKNGLNATVAAGKLNKVALGAKNGSFYYAKLGYRATIFAAGTTAFAIEYGNFSDVKQNEDEAKAFGLLCVQRLKDWNTELYAGYRRYQLDRPGVNYDDINAIMAGLRVKF